MKASGLRRYLLWAAIGYLSLLVVAAIFAPWLAPKDPQATDFDKALLGMNGEHWLGTDVLGRDTLSRIIFGSRVALLAALEATAIGTAIGIPLGLVIGYRGGWLDRVVMRIIDGLSSIPGIVLAIAIIAALGTGLTRSMGAVGLVFATVIARLTRGQVLAERERVYVDGARVAGASEPNILFRHVLPNAAPVLIVQVTVMFSAAVAIEAGLSFLGLGVQPPRASWGIMLSDAQDWIDLDAFQSVPPGLAIFFTVLSINLVGDQYQARVVGGRLAAAGNVLQAGHVARRVRAADAAPVEEVADVDDAALVVEGLTVQYATPIGPVTAVDGADLTVGRGEVLALVGESGCGKSSLGLGIAGLLAPPAQVSADRVEIRGADGLIELPGADEDQIAAWRAEVSVIFQEPTASLNPVHTVGRHLQRALMRRGASRADARARSEELLAQVRIPDPATTLEAYPHQISGGMAQRVMIALALAQDPTVLIADEPTTALDVTVQADVLEILRGLCRDLDLAVVLITHDLGVVADLADRAAVMYAGQIVESGSVESVTGRPRHPYSSVLASAVPRNEPGFGIPETIAGSVPSPGRWPEGCRFAGRCPHAVDACSEAAIPTERANGGFVACIRHADLELDGIPVTESA